MEGDRPRIHSGSWIVTFCFLATSLDLGPLAPGIQLLTFPAQVRKGEQGVDFLAIVPTWSVCGGLRGPCGWCPGLKTGLVGAVRIRSLGF